MAILGPQLALSFGGGTLHMPVKYEPPIYSPFLPTKCVDLSRVSVQAVLPGRFSLCEKESLKEEKLCSELLSEVILPLGPLWRGGGKRVCLLSIFPPAPFHGGLLVVMAAELVVDLAGLPCLLVDDLLPPHLPSLETSAFKESS